MNIRRTAEALVGSCIVFVAVVTCDGGGSSAGGSGASSGGGGRNGSGGGIVSSARADEPGSRLKVNFVDGADGSKHYLGTFFDAERNEDCSFRQLADGSYRCVPTDGTAVLANSYYADAGCTERLATFSATCSGPAAPKYILEYAQNACPTLYTAGAKHASTTIYVGAACSMTTAPQGVDFYTVGAAVELSSFVGGARKKE
jgi:hypothetical protein